MPSIDVAAALHKARHATGGEDPITPASIGAVDASDVTVSTSAGTAVRVKGTVVTYFSGWRALVRWDREGNVTYGSVPSGLAPSVSTSDGGIFIRRNEHSVTMAVVEATVTAANPEIPLPPVWLGPGGRPFPAVPFVFRTAANEPAVGTLEVGVSQIRFRGLTAGDRLAAEGTGGYGITLEWPTTRSLPTTLPGQPA